MSCGCNNSYSDGNAYYGACCPDVPYPQVSHESVPSLIDNLTTALYGAFYNPQTQTGFITKSVVNGRIVWNIACDPNNTAEVTGLPRNSGEGLLCYMIRAFNYFEGTQIPTFVTLSGTQNLTNKTLTSPVINTPTGILATDIGAGAFGSGVTLPATQLTTGAIPSGVTLPATQLTTGAIPSGVTISGSQVSSVVSNATTAAACSGNAATASAAQASSTLANILPKSFANVSAAGVVSNNVGLTITGGSPTSGVFTLTCTGVSASNVVLVTPKGPSGSGYASVEVPTTNTITVTTFSGSTATAEPFSIVIF